MTRNHHDNYVSLVSNDGQQRPEMRPDEHGAAQAQPLECGLIEATQVAFVVVAEGFSPTAPRHSSDDGEGTDDNGTLHTERVKS